MFIDMAAFVFRQVYHYVTMGIVQNRAFSLIWGGECDDHASQGITIVKAYSVTAGLPPKALVTIRPKAFK